VKQSSGDALGNVMSKNIPEYREMKEKGNPCMTDGGGEWFTYIAYAPESQSGKKRHKVPPAIRTRRSGESKNEQKKKSCTINLGGDFLGEAR